MENKDFKDNKLRIPLKSFTMRRAILLAAVGAILAGTGLRFTAYSASTYNISLGFGLFCPEMWLCLGFIVCAYLSQIWVFFGALPFWGLAAYNAYMILTHLGSFGTLAVIYVGAILVLAVFLFLAVADMWRDRRFFIVGSWALIVFLFLGSIVNQGPYFSVARIHSGEYSYVIGTVMIGKALAAMFLMMATIVWVQVLSRDMNRHYFGDKGRNLKQLSLNWSRMFRYR